MDFRITPIRGRRYRLELIEIGGLYDDFNARTVAAVTVAASDLSARHVSEDADELFRLLYLRRLPELRALYPSVSIRRRGPSAV